MEKVPITRPMLTSGCRQACVCFDAFACVRVCVFLNAYDQSDLGSAGEVGVRYM